MQRILITGPRVLTGGRFAAGYGVLAEDGRIAALVRGGDADGATPMRLPEDTLLAPGFIDVQVNGGGGILFNDQPTPQAALTIAAAHRKLGTTSILPTLITSPAADMEQAAAAIRQICGQGGVLGLHFEGPFLSPARPGVHRPDLIRAPQESDLALLEDLACRLPGPVLLTLAPERVPQAAVPRLAEAGVILSAGHTAAPFEAIVPPIRAVTHIFNAMEPISARAPGVAGAALAGDVYAGVIADAIHVHPALLRVLVAAKGKGRVMLVSDAMSVAGTEADGFDLQGRRIVRRDGRLQTEDGILAGADLSLAQAVGTMVNQAGVALEDALGMASRVPAAFLGLSGEYGDIAPGYRADMVLLSPTLDVLGTFLAGAWEAA